MKTAILTSLLLMTVSVLIHSVGLSRLLDLATNQKLTKNYLRRRNYKIRLLILVFAVLICLHTTEALIWGWAYKAQKCFNTFESSIYFSITTYTTVGSADLQLPHRLRMIGALESILGVLMFGWSSGFVVLILSKIHAMEGASLWHNAPDHTRSAVSRYGIS